MSKLTIENLDLYYGDFQALHGIHLDFEPHQISALIVLNFSGVHSKFSGLVSNFSALLIIKI